MLAVRALAVERGGRRLFANLSFAVAAGEGLAVAGPNGAGKSSLLRALAGLLRPAAGAVERPEAVAYLGHENALKPGRRLGGELAWWARLDRAPAARVAAAVERFALGPLLALPVELLSNGQRRRAALARVLASGAPLWLLDEPEVGLDARSLGALAEAVAAHRAQGGAVVAVSHGAPFAASATLTLGPLPPGGGAPYLPEQSAT